MEAHVTNHDGPIVIEDSLTHKKDEAPKDVAGVEKKKHAKGDFKYMRPIW
jgi:hypothetical protein